MNRRIPLLLFVVVAGFGSASLFLHRVEPDVPAADELLIRVTEDGTIELWHGSTRRSRERLPFRPSRWDDIESSRDGDLGDGVGDLITAAMGNRLAALTTERGDETLRVRVEAAPTAPSGAMFLVLRVLRSAFPSIPEFQLATGPEEEGFRYVFIPSTLLPLVDVYLLLDRRTDDPLVLDWCLGSLETDAGSIDSSLKLGEWRRPVDEADLMRAPFRVGPTGRITNTEGLVRATAAVDVGTEGGTAGGLRLGCAQERSAEAVAHLWTLPWGVWHQLLQVLADTGAIFPAVDCLLLMDETQ